MPLEIDDAGLDKLQAMEPGARQAKLATLSLEDQQAIAAKLPAWKAKRAQGMMTSAATGESVPGQKAPTENPPSLAPARPVVPIPKVIMGRGGPVYTDPDFLRHSAQNAVDTVQTAARPAAEAMVRVGKSLVTPERQAGAEVELRHYFSWLGGDKLVQSMPPEDYQRGIDEINQEHPVLGSKFVVSAADMVGGSIPYALLPGIGEDAAIETGVAKWLARGGLTPKTAPVLSTLSRLAVHAAKSAASGAALGTVQAYLTPDADLGEGALRGTKMGAALGGGAAAIGQLARGAGRLLSRSEKAPPAHLALLTPEGGAQLGEEIRTAISSGLSREDKTLISPRNEKPLNATFSVEDGKPIAIVSSISIGKDGQPKLNHVTFDLSTEDAGQKFQEFKQRSGVVAFDAPRDFLSTGGKSPAWWANVLGEGPVDRPLSASELATAQVRAKAEVSEPIGSFYGGNEDPTTIAGAPPFTVAAGKNRSISITPARDYNAPRMSGIAKPPVPDLPPPPPLAALGEATQPIDMDDVIKTGNIYGIPGGGSGPPTPGGPPAFPLPPSAPMNPGDMPPAMRQQLDLWKKAKATPGFFESLGKMASNAVRGRGFDSPMETVRINAQQLIASRDMRSGDAAYQKAMEKRAPALANNPDFERAALANWQGKLPDAEMEKKFPEAWGQLKELYASLKNQADARHQELASAGWIPPEYADLVKYADAKGTERYLPMVYLRRLAPQKYAKMVPDAMIDRAAQAIKAKWKVSDSRAADIVHAIIGSDDPAGAARAFGDPATKHLKGTKDLPPEVRELLGPANSILRVSKGLAIQDELVMRKRAFDAIRADPNSFSNTPRPGFVRIEGTSTPLDGKYWHSTINDAFQGSRGGPANTDKMAGVFWDVARVGKANLILGPRTLYKHIMGIWDASALSGGLYDSNPVATMRYIRDSFAALRSYAKDPSEGNALAKDVWAAKKVRGLEQNWVAAETRDSGVQRAIDAFQRDVNGGQAASDVYASAKRALFGAGNTLKELPPKAASAVYNTLNDVMRLANWKALADKFEKQGYERSVAEKLAGDRIAMSFPSGSNVGRLTEAIRSNPVSSVAFNFATPIMEKARAYSLLPMRLKQEPDLAARILAHEISKAAVFGLGIGAAATKGLGWVGALRAANGITNEEADAVKANMSRASQEFHPSALAGVIRDARGEPYFYDPGVGEFLLGALAGNPEDHWTKRAALNLLTEPMGEDAKRGVEAALQATGMMRGTQQPGGPVNPGMAGRAAGYAALGSGAVPAAVGSAIHAGVGLNPSSPLQRPNTPARAAMQAAGLPVVPPAQPAQAAKADTGELKELLKHNIATVARDQRLSPQEKMDAIKKILEVAAQDNGPIDRLQQRAKATKAAGNPQYIYKR